MALKHNLSAQPLVTFRNVELFALPTRTDNYTYLLRSPSELWVIDPGESEKVLNWCEENGTAVTHIVCTHHHHDHIDGVPALKEKFSCLVYASSIDQNRVPGADHGVNDNDTLKIASLDSKILFIPGHTHGHMALYFQESAWLFPGDTLFGLGCGRLFEGTAPQLFLSLQRLAKLPPETKIFCGHEYTARNLQFAQTLENNNPDIEKRGQKILADLMQKGTTLPLTLEEELKTNPFYRCHEPVLAAKLGLPSGTTAVETFTRLREKRNTF